MPWRTTRRFCPRANLRVVRQGNLLLPIEFGNSAEAVPGRFIGLRQLTGSHRLEEHLSRLPRFSHLGVHARQRVQERTRVVRSVGTVRRIEIRPCGSIKVQAQPCRAVLIVGVCGAISQDIELTLICLLIVMLG